MGRILSAATIVLLGFAWPFLTHWLAMSRLADVLSRDPRWWVIYACFVTILPTPAILYAGCIVYLRDIIPYPANAGVAALAATVLMAALAVLYFIVVGQIGFTTPVYL